MEVLFFLFLDKTSKWKYLEIITIVRLFFLLRLCFLFSMEVLCKLQPVFCFKCVKANQITPITRGTSGGSIKDSTCSRLGKKVVLKHISMCASENKKINGSMLSYIYIFFGERNLWEKEKNNLGNLDLALTSF